MSELTENQEVNQYVPSPRIKNALLKSSRTLGCRLSEFNKLDSGQNGQTYWANLAWRLDDNLRLHLEYELHKASLKQTLNEQPENIPIRWDKELPPALKFSSGICQLTEEYVQRVIQLFKLPDRLIPTKKPQVVSSTRPSLWDKIQENILSIEEIILESSLAQAASTVINVSIEQPYDEDEDGNSLQLYQDNEGTWRLSFQSFHKVTNEQASIIITVDEKETSVPHQLKYRDERWQFDEPLDVILEGYETLPHKLTALNVKYFYITDEDE
jgi:hypothetical protein